MSTETSVFTVEELCEELHPLGTDNLGCETQGLDNASPDLWADYLPRNLPRRTRLLKYGLFPGDQEYLLKDLFKFLTQTGGEVKEVIFFGVGEQAIHLHPGPDSLSDFPQEPVASAKIVWCCFPSPNTNSTDMIIIGLTREDYKALRAKAYQQP